jgi:hypothetical protein
VKAEHRKAERYASSPKWGLGDMGRLQKRANMARTGGTLTMIPTRIALFGALLITSAPALAQPYQAAPPNAPPPGGPPQARERGPGGMLRLFDANGDGRVTWDEVWAGVQQRFTAMDANGDGAVTMAEAVAARPARRPDAPPPPAGAPPRPERAQRVGIMFRGLDANQDGRVTLEEVRPAAEARFRALDANGDRVVTADELPRHRHSGPGGQGGHGGPGGPKGGQQRPAQPG